MDSSIYLYKNLHTLKILIAAGADVNVTNEYNETALLLSLETEHIEIAEFIINNGADPNIDGCTGALPIAVAIEKGYTEIIKLLLKLMQNAHYSCLHCSS